MSDGYLKGGTFYSFCCSHPVAQIERANLENYWLENSIIFETKTTKLKVFHIKNTEIN